VTGRGGEKNRKSRGRISNDNGTYEREKKPKRKTCSPETQKDARGLEGQKVSKKGGEREGGRRAKTLVR